MVTNMKDNIFAPGSLDEVANKLPYITGALGDSITDISAEFTRVTNALITASQGAAEYGPLDALGDTMRMPWVLLNGGLRVAAAATYRAFDQTAPLPAVVFGISADGQGSTDRKSVPVPAAVTTADLKVTLAGSDGKLTAAANVVAQSDAGSSKAEVQLASLPNGLAAGAQYHGMLWWVAGSGDYTPVAEIFVAVKV